MQNGQFIWSDLSTFEPSRARKDYGALFGWSFFGEKSYKFALSSESPVAAIFAMPKRLVEINMPSFWMSYISVDNLDAAVEKARNHNDVIVEIEPQPFNKTASIALIRDPSGAGFTLYEGPEFAKPAKMQGAGNVTARYHHVPDISLIEPFYKDLFGWSFLKLQDEPWPIYAIQNSDCDVIAFAEEVPESVRGKFRYWMPCFSVLSTTELLTNLKRLSGTVFSELPDERVLVADRQGAHFMIQPRVFD